MLSLVIDPVIARLPERIRETERREVVSRDRMEQAQLLLQAAQQALLRSQECLVQQRPKECVGRVTPGTGDDEETL